MSVFPGDKYEGLSQYMLYGGIPMVVLKKEDADKAKPVPCRSVVRMLPDKRETAAKQPVIWFSNNPKPKRRPA